MGISLVIIKTDLKKDIDGNKVCPIQLQYKFKGSYKRFPLKIYIEPKFWKGGVISNKCEDYTNIQKTITSLRKRMEDVITEIKEMGGIPTPHLVKLNFDKSEEIQMFKQPKGESFWVCYKQFLEEKKNYNRGYTKTLISLNNTLEKFEKETKKKMSFDYIFYGSFEYEFKSFCLKVEIPQKKGSKIDNVGLSNNYVNKILSNLKIFLSWCKQNRKVTESVKFKSLKMVRSDVLVYLNTSEVKKMYDYKKYDYPNDYPNVELIKDIDRNGNIIYRNNLELIKDIFTFQCSVGCRWGDIHNMSVGMFKIEKGFFVWTMSKTKDNIKVPENDVSLGIFRKYSKGKSQSQFLFPKYSQQKFNLHLKDVGKQLGFNRLIKREILVGSDYRKGTEKDVFTYELLSSHSGRRSFIKNLIDLGTMDNWSIMKLSGHKTISSFQKYVSVTSKDILKGQDLYSKEFDTKEEKQIREFIRKYPLEKIIEYYQKYK
jgi:integrase